MRLPEQRLWDAMSSHVATGVWLQRVENGFGAGMPDVMSLVKFTGAVAWLELKASDEWPVRESTPVLGEKKGLNVDQRNWHLQWKQHNGWSWILVGIGRHSKRELFLIPGRRADEVNGFTRKDLAHHKVTWIEVNNILLAQRS
jgi:hypothetical protein